MTLCSEDKKANRLMPEIVWLPTYLGMLLIVLWKFDSRAVLVVYPISILCSLILELIYRAVFGEKRHSFSCRATAFCAQCIIWGLIFYFGVFGMWSPSH